MRGGGLPPAELPMRAEGIAPLHLTTPDEVVDVGTLFVPTMPKVAL